MRKLYHSSFSREPYYNHLVFSQVSRTSVCNQYFPQGILENYRYFLLSIAENLRGALIRNKVSYLLLQLVVVQVKKMLQVNL
jgi:hypothetical protein